MIKKIFLLITILVFFLFPIQTIAADFSVSFGLSMEDQLKSRGVKKIETYTTKEGDTLLRLAKERYGKEKFWRIFTRWWNKPASTPLSVGTKLIIPPLSGKINGFNWEDVTYKFTNLILIDAAYDFTKHRWLVTGITYPNDYSTVRQAISDHTFYQRGEGAKYGGAVYFDGKNWTSLIADWQKVTDGRATNVGFDGQKYWISTNHTNRRIGKNTQIITFDGNQFSTTTDIFNLSIYESISKISGSTNNLLLGGVSSGQRPLLFYLKNGQATDLSKQFEKWRINEITDIKYNGSIWYLTVDSQLYSFDGKKLEYLSERPELKKYLGQWNDGIQVIDWNPKKKVWILGGKYDHGRTSVLLEYNSEKRTVKKLKTLNYDQKNRKFGDTIYDLAWSPFGIVVNSGGEIKIYQNNGKIISLGKYMLGEYSNISCGEKSCLLIDETYWGDNAAYLISPVK
jgi:hypothetical protein